jgi:hypothetical protein
LNQIRKRLTYANVMSSLAVFLILGGGVAFAATKLGKNSVGTKQIKNGAVTGAKIKKRTITGAQVNLAKLGTVPSANTAATAGTANALSPPEAIHLVGMPGQPGFEGGSVGYGEPGVTYQPVGFYKDKEGVVHLEGVVQVGKEKGTTSLVPIFTLPPGFRPANSVVQIFPSVSTNGVVIAGSNASYEGHGLSGNVLGSEGETLVLSGITYRAGG